MLVSTNDTACVLELGVMLKMSWHTSLSDAQYRVLVEQADRMAGRPGVL